MRFDDLLEQVPHWDRYPTLDEITDHARGLSRKPGFRVEPIGRSRLGRDIDLITFRSGGSSTILLSGFHDPHEPICSLSIMWLCAQLADADSPLHVLGCDWAIVPCGNPDGTARNDGWFQHPADLRAFLNCSYEDDLSFWGPPQQPEEYAAEEAIVRTRPTLRFAMHDESHFPGHGYWALVSDEAVLDGLGEHFEYESRLGVERVPAPVEPEVMRDNWYYKRALELSGRCLSMICEPRAYRRLVPPREATETQRAQLEAALEEYESALAGMAPTSGDERALIRCAASCRERMHKEELFAICVGACGLRLLKAHGEERKAESIEKAFWDYLSARLEGTFTTIPVRDQVRVQLHFLLSVVERARAAGY